MIEKSAIGKIIQKLRKDKNLTQEELAEKIDISPNYLSKVERGLNILNVESFLKTAEVLGFSLEDFGIKTDKNVNPSKKALIEKILTSSEKEILVYSELFDAMKSIMKILK